MAETGAPVIFDATHSVQQPGGLRWQLWRRSPLRSGALRAQQSRSASRASSLKRHEAPDTAPSDGPNMLPLKDFEPLMRELMALDALVKRRDRALA